MKVDPLGIVQALIREVRQDNQGMVDLLRDEIAAGLKERDTFESALQAQQPTSLNVLGSQIIEINRANGWKVVEPDEWPVEEGVGATYKIGTILALIHSEVSEALEAVRKYDRANFEEELADVLIRVLDCSAGLGIDMDATVRAKLEKNRQRGFRHGGKAI